MKKPESIHFHKPTTKTIYATLLAASIAAFILFIYVTYLAYSFIVDTIFNIFSYILLTLIIVAIVLKIILITLGRAGFSKELFHLKKYKHKISFH